MFQTKKVVAIFYSSGAKLYHLLYEKSFKRGKEVSNIGALIFCVADWF